nr:caspase family protein [Kibdelosporangium sp. MJ126-NF4]CEL23503.1 High-affnity carbon uptake protein Hat/HatR [Kibdelosporangium sp. MJ126-NF4]CTQ89117.1 High-affnity carbon uptake protein Hat/HatR [Kibdelosporangium sp. MJ126-NF4]
MERRRIALLIATDQYDDPAFGRLKAPVNDVTRLGEVLGDPEIGAFTVTTLLNEPHYVVRREISRICAEAQRDDLILFYVSGHGIKEEGRGSLHFVTTDTDRGHLRTSSVEAELVRGEIDQSRARQAIVWLDCCYSGAFPTGGSPKSAMDADVLSQMKLEGRGTFVMTASTHIQYAYEPRQDARTVGATEVSVFTKAIVEGLRTGAADVDGDGEIGTADLYEYVYQHVRERTPNQTPMRNDLASGELLVARNKFALRLPDGLDPGIRDMLRHPSSMAREAAIGHLAKEARNGDRTARVTLEILRSNRDQGLAEAASRALAPPPDVEATKAARRPPSTPIALPVRGESRVSGRQQMWAALALCAVAIPLTYTIWLYKDSASIVLWLVIGLVSAVGLIGLTRFLYCLFSDASTVLHRAATSRYGPLSFSPDGEKLFGHETEWSTREWRKDDTSERVIGGGRIYSPDNKMVVGMAPRVGRVALRERGQRDVLRRLPTGHAVAFSPDSRLVAVVAQDRVEVLQADSGDPVVTRTFAPHRRPSVEFDPAGRFLAVSTRNAQALRGIRLYRTTSWEPVETPLDLRYVSRFAFNHDGSVLAVIGFKSAVDLYRTDDWRLLASVTCRTPPHCVDFSPDGALMGVGDRRGRITLYSTATWQVRRSMGWHYGPVSAVRFSPDSGVLASTSIDDKTLRLWPVSR